MVKISVIIPTYNRGHLIKETLRSVFTQTYEDYEILVIDDGSTDKTAKIIEEMCTKNSKIRYIKHEVNRGVSAARNTGILNSKGEYIAFLDSDDKWVSTKLEEQIKVFQRFSNNIGLIYSGFIIHERERQIQNCFPRFEGYIFMRLLSQGNFISCSSVIIPKKIFDDVGLFDEHMIFGQDYDLWLRITKKYTVRFIPKLLVNYDISYGDRISLKYRDRAIDTFLIYKKYMKNIKLLNVSHKYFFTIGTSFILNGKGKLGRYIILKTILKNPKKMRYMLFLFLSFFLKFNNISLLDTKIGRLFIKIYKMKT